MDDLLQGKTVETQKSVISVSPQKTVINTVQYQSGKKVVKKKVQPLLNQRVYVSNIICYQK